LNLTSPFARSTVPGAQTWIGFTQEYSAAEVVKRDIQPELSDRRSRLRSINAICEERDLLAVIGRNFGVEVKLETSVSTHVGVIHALDRTFELRPSDRTLNV